MLDALPPSPENDRLRVELAAVLCRYSPLFGDTRRAIRLAETALASADPADVVSRARLIFGLAVAHGLEGSAAEAAVGVRSVPPARDDSGDVGLAAEVLALSAQDKDALRPLARGGPAVPADRRLGRGAARGTGSRPLAGLGYPGLAEIYLERFEREQAEASVERGMALVRPGGSTQSTPGMDPLRAAPGAGRSAGALAEIERLERIFRRGDDPLLATRHVLIAGRWAIGQSSGRDGAVVRLLEAARRAGRRRSAGAPAGGCPRTPEVGARRREGVGGAGRGVPGAARQGVSSADGDGGGASRDGRFGLLIQVYLLEALALQRNTGPGTRRTQGRQGQPQGIRGRSRHAWYAPRAWPSQKATC